MPIGPWPLWLWLAIIGGGLLIAFVLVPKLRGTSSSAGSLGSGDTSGNPAATPLDQSLYDPSTGVPLSVETATNPATGLPNYNNLVGLQNTTQTIAATQSNPSDPRADLSATNMFVVGADPAAGNTLRSLGSFFRLRYGADDIYGNPANAGIRASVPYNNAQGFNTPLAAGTAVYIPASRIQG
jgi:hypothetical protein